MSLMDHETIEREQLVERYVTGKLSAEELAAFEEHYLDCDECLDQVEAAERLHRGLERVAEEEATKALRRGFLVTLLSWLASRSGALLLSALVVAMLVPLVWQQRRVSQLRDDLETTRRELATAQGGDQAQLDSLHRQLEEARASQAAAESHWSTELDAARAEGADLASRLAVALAPQINARIVSLSPFRDVGVGETPKHPIELPPEDSWVVLAVDAGSGEAPAYRARLSRGNRVLWSSSELAPDELGAVVVSFPPSFLEAGEYRLEIEETRRPGTPVARYPLQVTPPG